MQKALKLNFTLKFFPFPILNVLLVCEKVTIKLFDMRFAFCLAHHPVAIQVKLAVGMENASKEVKYATEKSIVTTKLTKGDSK